MSPSGQLDILRQELNESGLTGSETLNKTFAEPFHPINLADGRGRKQKVLRESYNDQSKLSKMRGSRENSEGDQQSKGQTIGKSEKDVTGLSYINDSRQKLLVGKLQEEGSVQQAQENQQNFFMNGVDRPEIYKNVDSQNYGNQDIAIDS